MSKYERLDDLLLDDSPATIITDLIYFVVSLQLMIKCLRLKNKVDVRKENAYNQIAILKFLAFINITMGTSFGIGAFHHAFCLNPKTDACHYPTWLMSIFLGVTNAINVPLLPLLLIKSWSKEASTKYFNIIITISILSGLEEVVFAVFGFGTVIFIGVLLVTITAIPSLFSKFRLKSISFRPVLLYTGCLLLLGYMTYFEYIGPACRSFKQTIQGKCPFGYDFNHNALLHVVLSVSFYFMTHGFIDEEIYKKCD